MTVVYPSIALKNESPENETPLGSLSLLDPVNIIYPFIELKKN